jgi:NADH-quinone oxidoreductase subunit M
VSISTAPILSLVTFLPLVGVAFILFLPRDAEQNARYIALWTTLATFAASLLLWTNFDPASADFQFVEEGSWIGPIKYKMGVDGI